MTGTGTQPLMRQAEVGAANLSIEQGGSGCPDIGTDLFGVGTISPAIRVRDMVTDTSYTEGAGRITP